MHNVDKILSEYVVPQIVKDYFPGGWNHHDKGIVLFYLYLATNRNVKSSVFENLALFTHKTFLRDVNISF